MDQLIKDHSDFAVWLVDKSNLYEFCKFVVSVNYKRYIRKSHNAEVKKETLKVYHDDFTHFDQTFFYMIRNKNGDIIATIKVTQWNKLQIFPIQREFGISIDDFIDGLAIKPKKAWHLGRLAIDRDFITCDANLIRKNVTILKMLFLVAFRHICEDESNVVFAECDSRLYEKLRLFGIDSAVIGESRYYLGSQTTPIFAVATGLKKFVSQYGHYWDL